MNNCASSCKCKLTGIISNKKPLVSQIHRIKKVKEVISFAPYVKNETLYFRTQAEVNKEKEELTIYNE